MNALVIAALVMGAIGVSPLRAELLPSDHRIVPGVRIGSAYLAPADQGALTREVGEPDASDQTGDHAFYRYGQGSPPDELVVDFDLTRDQPFEISTASPLYQMQEGLGVGAKAAEIRAKLGRPLCQGINDAGDGVIVYPNAWFQMERGAAKKISIRKDISAEDFRDRPIPCR